MIKTKMKKILDYLLNFSPLITLFIFSSIYASFYQSFIYIISFANQNSYFLLIFSILISIPIKLFLIYNFSKIFIHIYRFIFKKYQLTKVYWRVSVKIFQIFICEFLLLLLFFLITKSSLWTFMLLLKDLYLSNTIFSFVFSLGLIIRVLLMSLTLFIHE